MCIVEWCNLNSGFLTGVLSLLTLVVSVIAIVVSIHTAKLPYKKEIKLSSSIDVFFSRNDTTGETDSQIIGVSVNAANVGSRNVNITYLGICVKDKSLHNGQEKMAKIRDREHCSNRSKNGNVSKSRSYLCPFKTQQKGKGISLCARYRRKRILSESRICTAID